MKKNFVSIMCLVGIVYQFLSMLFKGQFHGFGIIAVLVSCVLFYLAIWMTTRFVYVVFGIMIVFWLILYGFYTTAIFLFLTWIIRKIAGTTIE